VGPAVKLDKIVAEGASSHDMAMFRLAIHAPDRFDHPNTLVVVTARRRLPRLGSRKCSSRPPALTPGLYWLAVVPSGGSRVRPIGNGHLPGGPTTAFAPGETGATNEPNCFYMDGAGKPPATMSTWGSTTNAVKVMVRAAD
jgi:hypothetical protein